MARDKKSAYKFSYEELSGICSQVALIMRSGIRIDDGLEAMCGGRDKTSRTQEILLGMAEDIKNQSRFCDAADKTGAFPTYMVGMMELGEKTGRLDDVMMSLSHHYKREERLRGMIFGSVFYPAVLLVMIIIVIAVLVTKILPVFSRVLEDMGIEPSPFVRAILYIGGYGSRYVFIALLIVFAIGGGLFAYSKLSGKRGALRSLIFAIPVIRRISEKIAAGQFAFAMELALTSGYNIDDAFALIHNIITNRRAIEKIKSIEESVADGKSFSQAVITAGIFDGMSERMVSVGDKTGRVDEVMREIAKLYEEETTIALNNLAAVIEPIMVAFLALVTGVILLAIMLPLIGIISSMN